MKNVTIYTDGACSGNPGAGGWGAVLICDNNIKQISGGKKETTNNQMELQAAISALEELKLPCNVELFSDSKYLLDGLEKWMINWKKNNWKTASKQPVKNIELWQKLDALKQVHNIKFTWIKGHSGDKYNEIADQLATSAIVK